MTLTRSPISFSDGRGQPEVRRIRFHDVRHTDATLLLESGADISVVSKRLGHANVGFTAKVYAHVTNNLSQATADRFSAYLSASQA